MGTVRCFKRLILSVNLLLLLLSVDSSRVNFKGKGDLNGTRNSNEQKGGLRFESDHNDVPQMKKDEQLGGFNGVVKNYLNMSNVSESIESKEAEDQKIDDESRNVEVKNKDDEFGNAGGSEEVVDSKSEPSEKETNDESNGSVMGIEKDILRDDECDPSNMCVDEKKNLTACLRVSGNAIEVTTAVKESDILNHIIKLPEKDRTWRESSLKEILEAKLKYRTEMAGGKGRFAVSDAELRARAKRKAKEISSSSTGTDSGSVAEKKQATSTRSGPAFASRWSMRKGATAKPAEMEVNKDEELVIEEVVVLPQEKAKETAIKAKGLEGTSVSMDPLEITLTSDFLSSEKVDECVLPEADKLLIPVAAHRLDTLNRVQVAELGVGHILHGLQHSLYLKNEVKKLEEEMLQVKDKLRREIAEVKVKADEAKKKALSDQKMKMDVDHGLRLSASIDAAVEKERVKWQTQVVSLEDDKLELESERETLLKELTETTKDELAAAEEDAMNVVAFEVIKAKAKLALAVYQGRVDKEGCKQISDDYLDIGSIADLLDSDQLVTAAPTAESSSPKQDSIKANEEAAATEEVVPDTVVPEASIEGSEAVPAQAADQEVVQELDGAA